jgi:hypothetical protein
LPVSNSGRQSPAHFAINNPKIRKSRCW